ncbi:MAG: hypothetical protein ACRENG_06365 [bacterium]
MDRDSFDKLLAWLSADRKVAAAKYEECRRALIDFFQNKGCKHSDECADATFDRVVEILLGGRMGERKDAVSYLLRVAHFVRLEYLRNPASLIGDPGKLRDDDDMQEGEDEWLVQRRQECMEKCLQGLPIESRELVTHYYEIRTTPEKAKKKVEKLEELAKLHHKTPNALRIEVHRMRTEKLKPCLDECLKKL